MKARVHVMLKNGVLDPQGEAVRHALGALGFDGVEGVRQGKVIEVARRKVGGRRQWRIKVRFTDGFEKWYSRREIDTFLKEQ